MNPKFKARLRTSGMGLLAFVVALAIWLPCLHFPGVEPAGHNLLFVGWTNKHLWTRQLVG